MFLGYLTALDMLSYIASTLVIALLCAGTNTQSTVPPNSRIDCDPAPGASQDICQQRGCIWD